MNAMLHSEESAPIHGTALAVVPADDVGRLVLRIDPGATWLRSDWPVDRIWRVNQPDADPEATVDVSADPVRLEVRRRGDAVTLRRLGTAESGFRAALGRGATLEAAALLALAEDPAFDLTTALRALLDEALIVGLTLKQT
jgi:hypothetical protein